MGLTRLILLGGGGHCASVIDCIERAGGFEIAGILDLAERVGERLLGYLVIGTDRDLPEVIEGGQALITVGQIRSPEPRRAMFLAARAAGATMATVVSPRANVSRHAQLGAGSVAMHDVLLNAGASVGENTILNSRALVEHDATVGDHCHISTGAIVNGDCAVGDGCFVGSGAVIAHGVRVAEGCLIGAGSVVMRDTQPNTTYLGVPARPIP